MKVFRLLALALCLTAIGAPAHAHGNGGLLMIIGLASAPILFVIFVPLLVLSGMAGRRWIAFGLYLTSLIGALYCQVQDWYHPFARRFPDLDWLQERLPDFIFVPPLDVILWMAITVIALGLALRNWRVPLGFAGSPQPRNLIFGTLFSLVAALLWSFVLLGPPMNAIRLWPGGLNMLFELIWLFLVPIVAVFVAIALFRDGRLTLPRRTRR